jgi:putative SOS response-associated peptidase YedK
MCGRYELNCTPAGLRRHFGALLPEPCWSGLRIDGSYNIAPGRPCPVIRYGKREGHNVIENLTWGFRPSWAKKPWINARDDRLFEAPAFRESARRRRALVIATGWYEWRPAAERSKQPYYIHFGHLVAFAGIWTARKLGEGEWELSFAIVTTASGGVVRDVHERMPLIMAPDDYAAWLDPLTPSPEALIRPYGVDRMTAYPVSTRVNAPGNDGPACIEPLIESTAVAGDTRQRAVSTLQAPPQSPPTPAAAGTPRTRAPCARSASATARWRS